MNRGSSQRQPKHQNSGLSLPFPIVHLGGQCQLYVLLFECYSDRSEWKQGLAAVSDSLRCVPPDFQVNTQNPPLYRTLYSGTLCRGSRYLVVRATP